MIIITLHNANAMALPADHPSSTQACADVDTYGCPSRLLFSSDSQFCGSSPSPASPTAESHAIPLFNIAKKPWPLIRTRNDKDNDTYLATLSLDLNIAASQDLKTNELQKIKLPRSMRTDFGRRREKALAVHQEKEDQSSISIAPRSPSEMTLTCKNTEENDVPMNELRHTSLQLEDELLKLDPNLGSQFERLFSAIDGVTNQMHIAFEALQKRVDSLQTSIEADHSSGWKSLITCLDRQRLQPRYSKKEPVLHPLQETIQTATEKIKLLSGLLIIEKDANMMHERNFEDRHGMLLRLMKPYLHKPAFQQFWHVKHAMDHCVSSVLFKTSRILARTGNMVGSSSTCGTPTEEVQFKKFCKKGMRGLEQLAEWAEEKWSENLKREFEASCKDVWQIQKMVAASTADMSCHEIEILHPDPCSKLDVVNMDLVDDLSIQHFHPVVQFTVFPGFKIDDSVLVKPQVYLVPKQLAF